MSRRSRLFAVAALVLASAACQTVGGAVSIDDAGTGDAGVADASVAADATIQDGASSPAQADAPLGDADAGG